MRSSRRSPPGSAVRYERVMKTSGERVKELADNVSRIAANEHVLHNRVDEMGNYVTTETRDYDYVASISEEKPGFVVLDEYRSEQHPSNNVPDEIKDTRGFATLALVFHPADQADFEMTCEGLGSWHEQAAWVVYFKERVTQHDSFQVFRVGRPTFFGAPERPRLDHGRQLSDRADRGGTGKSGTGNPVTERATDRRVRPCPVSQKANGIVASEERGNLSRLSSTPLLPPAQLRSLHAVFSGCGGKAERTHSAADAPRPPIGGWQRARPIRPGPPAPRATCVP